MKKNYLLGMAFMALTWTNCTQDDSLNLVSDENSVFTGEMESVGSRTSLGDDNKISWLEGDWLSIFQKNNLNKKYKVSTVTNGTATFVYDSYKVPTTGKLDLNSTTKYAIYPYSEANAIAADGTISAPVPAGYTYVNRSSFISSALMASTATSTNTNFSFKNVQGYLRLRLCAEIAEDYPSAVESVTLTSTKNLNGTAKITWNGNIPVVSSIEGAEPENKTLTVALATQQALPSEASGDYIELYVPVCPMEFQAGEIALTINFAGGNDTYKKSNTGTLTILRGEVKGMKLVVRDDETMSGVIEEDVIDHTATNEQSFIEALQQGGEIVLENDVVLNQTSTIINKNVTINLNGYEIKASREIIEGITPVAKDLAVLFVDGCELTIKGQGSIINTAQEAAYGIALDNGAKVTIEGDITCGAYHDAIYVKHGELNIKNGFYYASEDKDGNIDQTCGQCHRSTVINCSDDHYQVGAAKISLTGGVYVNFDPSNVHEGKWHNQNFVATGYKVVSETKANGDVWYQVVPE